MNYPTTRIVFDRKKIASTSKAGLIQIEVLYNRKRMFLSTGVKVYAGQWKDKTMVTSRLDSLELNNRIAIIHDRVKEYINECIKDKKEFSFEALGKFLQLSTDNNSFIDFVEKRIQERRMEEGTRKGHWVLFRKLLDFGVIQGFSDLTVKNIKLFDDYLRKSIEKQTSISTVHKRMKVYVNEAVQFELILKNPYDQFTIQRGESTQRKYLTSEELEKVRNAGISNPSISGVRDCFVFCCFTGLAFADLTKFDWEKDVEHHDGKCIIRDSRQKTGTSYNITLLSPALEILSRYDYRLPKMSNQQYNMRLKLVSEYAGINKPLTSHMARHTFATWALTQGIRIEVVSKMLAHTDIKTTQIYAKILQSEVTEGFDQLECRLAVQAKKI